MKHIIFIDSLDKLNLKKDSSLMLALTFQEAAEEVYLLFEQNFYNQNRKLPTLKLSKFQGEFEQDSFYLKSFELCEEVSVELKPGDLFHMRIDPPVDMRYIRFLWQQDMLEDLGVKVINSPKGILLNNEKLVAYKDEATSVPTYLGDGREGLELFLKDYPCKEYVMKPLDLFSGIGVEKVGGGNQMVADRFEAKVKELNASLIVQPFIKEVYQGEIRTVYYAGEEIGTILKVPNEGEFLTNIAQGAKYHRTELSVSLRAHCERFAKQLYAQGIPWLAFDILGDYITEINITCPGLLVEVSTAMEKNLASDILRLIKS